MSLYIEHHTGLKAMVQFEIEKLIHEEAQGNEDGEDGLVGGADDPEVVEGAPGCLLSGHHLVLPSTVAHPHLSILFCAFVAIRKCSLVN